MVVDTQVIFWTAYYPDKLTVAARAAIEFAEAQQTLAVSDKSLWELAMMLDRGVLEAAGGSERFLEDVETRFLVLPITAAIAKRSVQFTKGFPNDPADRIIAATAFIHGLPLITADEKIRRSGEVPCIW